MLLGTDRRPAKRLLPTELLLFCQAFVFRECRAKNVSVESVESLESTVLLVPQIPDLFVIEELESICGLKFTIKFVDHIILSSIVHYNHSLDEYLIVFVLKGHKTNY